MKPYFSAFFTFVAFLGQMIVAHADTNFTGNVNAINGSYFATYSVVAISGYVSSGTYMEAPDGIFDNSLKVGGSTVTGSLAVALGAAATASSYSSVVLGRYNLSLAGSATAWTSTDPLFVIGNGTSTSARANALTILKDGTVSINGATVGTGVASFASGKGTQATSYGQTVFGQYNTLPSGLNTTTWVATDPLFVIGNGSSTARSNALTVLKNGTVLVKPAGDLSMGTYTAGTQP